MKVSDDHLKRGPESTLESRHLKSLDYVVITPAVNTETPGLNLLKNEKKQQQPAQCDPKQVRLTWSLTCVSKDAAKCDKQQVDEVTLYLYIYTAYLNMHIYTNI